MANKNGCETIGLGTEVRFQATGVIFQGTVVDIEEDVLYVAVIGYRSLWATTRSAAMAVARRPERTAELEQLWQCRTPIWDGNLVSKAARDRLAAAGLVQRTQGWNLVTEDGLLTLVVLGLLRA